MTRTKKPRPQCGCGRRMRYPEADQCWVCLRIARMEARRVCKCGTQIRTSYEMCSRCRHAPQPRPVEVDRPFHWVGSGGIMHPVFEDVA